MRWGRGGTVTLASILALVAGCSGAGSDADSASDTERRTTTTHSAAPETPVDEETAADHATTSSTASLAEPPTPPVPAELVWSVNTTVLSDTSFTEGVLTIYQQDGEGDMTLGAYDAASGKQLWSFAATPSAVAMASAPAVLELDDGPLVLTLEPSPEGWGELVALDLKDGTEAARAPESLFVHEPPHPCYPDETTICFTAWSDDSDSYTDMVGEVHGRTITISPEPDELERDTAEDEDRSWFTTESDSGTVTFAFYEQGDLVWEVPVEDLGYTADVEDTTFGSWSPGDDVIIASVNWLPAAVWEAGDLRMPVADLRTTAFATATGDVLWSRSGVVMCGGAGGRNPAAVTLCAGEGSLQINTGEFDGDDGTLQGVGAAAGDVLWEKNITAEDWTALENTPGVLEDGLMLLPRGDDIQLLDVATGETSAPDSDTRYWCFETHRWTYETPRDPASPEPGDRSSDYLSFGCTLDGDPVELEALPAGEDFGNEMGDLQVITRPDRLEAYQVG